MEKLTHLMQLIDANSGVLPEGVYLEMCNDMKEVHDNMKGFDDTASYDGVRYACLLYTSPSPRDGLLSRMPSSA